MIKAAKALDLPLAQWPLWERFQLIDSNNRFPQSLLLIGSKSTSLIDFVYTLSAALFCGAEQRPCGECKSCRLLRAREHPDFTSLIPDKNGGVIKIDQIRELSSLVYTTPQLTGRRIVIINPAEKMNVAAANALLKLLEEPPAFLTFILIAEQISTLPATIISRCQQWHFRANDLLEADYLSMAEDYQVDSDRGQIFSQLLTIINDLKELRSKKRSLCSLAAKWTSHELSHLIWLLYLINSQMIDYRLTGPRHEKTWTTPLYELAKHYQPLSLYKQLDQINSVSKILHQNIALNQTLVLEKLLMGYQ